MDRYRRKEGRPDRRKERKGKERKDRQKEKRKEGREEERKKGRKRQEKKGRKEKKKSELLLTLLRCRGLPPADLAPRQHNHRKSLPSGSCS